VKQRATDFVPTSHPVQAAIACRASSFATRWVVELAQAWERY